mmetsp:Transcript_73053/g.143250  ORF Transcript_73053/g.143250 Transcript_73053/m.143250 type:complete len:201 (-) Transcript_73053:111-713(-)
MLVPNVQRASLVLHIAMRDEDQRGEHIADLASIHLAPAQGPCVDEVGACVRQNRTNIFDRVVTQPHELQGAEKQLDRIAVDLRHLAETEEGREQIDVLGAVRDATIRVQTRSQPQPRPIYILNTCTHVTNPARRTAIGRRVREIRGKSGTAKAPIDEARRRRGCRLCGPILGLPDGALVAPAATSTGHHQRLVGGHATTG